MMLNRHRFVEGCPQAIYPDERRALLLPYPDFKAGEGKKVETLCKKKGVVTGVPSSVSVQGVTLDANAGENRVVDQKGGVRDGDGGDEDEEDEYPTLEGTSADSGPQVHTILPPADLFWKVAPPPQRGKGEKAGGGVGRRRRIRLSHGPLRLQEKRTD